MPSLLFENTLPSVHNQWSNIGSTLHSKESLVMVLETYFAGAPNPISVSIYLDPGALNADMLYMQPVFHAVLDKDCTEQMVSGLLELCVVVT